MFIQIQHASLLQIFCKYVTNSEVFFESIKGTDNNCQEDFQAWWVNVNALLLDLLTHSHSEIPYKVLYATLIPFKITSE